MIKIVVGYFLYQLSELVDGQSAVVELRQISQIHNTIKRVKGLWSVRSGIHPNIVGVVESTVYRARLYMSDYACDKP